jgi:hypothetical protein
MMDEDLSVCQHTVAEIVDAANRFFRLDFSYLCGNCEKCHIEVMGVLVRAFLFLESDPDVRQNKWCQALQGERDDSVFADLGENCSVEKITELFEKVFRPLHYLETLLDQWFDNRSSNHEYPDALSELDKVDVAILGSFLPFVRCTEDRTLVQLAVRLTLALSFVIGTQKHTHTHTHIHTHTHTRTHVPVRGHEHMHTCTHAYTHAHAHT